MVGFIFFLIWELTEEHPVVDLSLFTRRNFWSGTVALYRPPTRCSSATWWLLPLWLQQIMGYPATAAGLAMAPVGLLAILLMPVVGRNVSRVDPRLFATFSFLVFALVFWMRSRFTTDVDFTGIMIPTLVQGIAMAFFFVPLINLAMSGLSPDRIPAASGLTNFVRITAGAFGTSIFTTLWDSRAALHHAQLSEAINAGSGSPSNSARSPV